MDEVEFVRKGLLKRWEAYEAGGGKQTDFAKAAGVRQGVLSTWITKLRAGEVPKLEGIVALARGFGIPAASLFPALASRVQDKAPAIERSSPPVAGTAPNPGGVPHPHQDIVDALRTTKDVKVQAIRGILGLEQVEKPPKLGDKPKNDGPHTRKPR